MTKAETGRWPTISRLTCGDADAGDHGFYAMVAASALYWHCVECHEGQGSERYSIMSARLGYRPGASESGVAPDDVLAVDLQDMLDSGELEPADLLAEIEALLAAEEDQ